MSETELVEGWGVYLADVNEEGQSSRIGRDGKLTDCSKVHWYTWMDKSFGVKIHKYSNCIHFMEYIL